MNYPIQQVRHAVEQHDAIDVARHLGFFRANFQLIAGIAVLATCVGLAYAYIASPVYEASFLLQVEDNAGSPKNNILADLSSAFDMKTVTASEMEVLRSRSVLSRVVEDLHLYISAQPKYLFGVGAWIARHSRTLSSPGLFGIGGYAWGAEQVVVSIFNMPEILEGKTFVLTAQDSGNFRLNFDDRKIDVQGKVGDTLHIPTADGSIELLVDKLEAQSGTQFLLVRNAKLEAVEKLQKDLIVLEKGKQSGIISMSLEASDPRLAGAILNHIAQDYLHQNADRRSEDAERSLAFLNNQLPAMKRELERSETALNYLRTRYGVIDLGEEAKATLQQSVAVQTRMLELKQKREELLARFEKAHPAVIAVTQQIRTVGNEQANLDAKIKRLPAIEQDVLRLSRDVKVNTELYMALLGTAQQLRLAAGSRVRNVRLLDMAAEPTKPVRPKRMAIVSLSSMIGVCMGLVVALARKRVHGRVDNPAEIERLLGLPVSVTIPHSKNQVQLNGESLRADRKLSLLPYDKPFDSAIESLHRFRTLLQFAMHGSRNNVIMITGPTPAVGKSFVSANFAIVLASIGKKVLVIDADMRTGHLHQYFGVQQTCGLSEAIMANASLEQVVHKGVAQNVDFVATGGPTSKPAELLAQENFGSLLEQFSAHYDYVLIDTAPVLAVSDALTIASHAGMIFNIVRGGVSTVEEIEETVKRLNQAGQAVTGIVLNDLKSQNACYGYGSKYEMASSHIVG